MITSVKNERIKEIGKLKNRKYRYETGLYLVEGFHLVEEARSTGVLQTIITTLDKTFEEETLQVEKHVMSHLAFTKTPQPIMGICKMLKDVQINFEASRTVILDNLQDPGNLGTIIRTCVALNVDQLIISSDTVDLYNDKVLRSTQGGIFKLNIVIGDLKQIIPELKQHDINVVGSSLHQATIIDEVKHNEKMAFVMGNEGNGISDEVLSLCDQTLFIPMYNTESLNVAIATSIILWEFRK